MLEEPQSSLTSAYRDGLDALLRRGHHVPSVLGAFSKASNFGKGDRPWIELIGYGFTCQNSRPSILTSAAFRTHVPYLLGLLAWTLDGRDDLDSLYYYRRAAADYSDDGATMCGAFGARMRATRNGRTQLAAVLERLRHDPSSRRTFIPIIEARDNLIESREYPCAAGVQLFVRGGALHWLTLMRAQQALTVLPYDASLFSLMQHFIAAELGLEVGSYGHFSGTFHIYEDERSLATTVRDVGAEELHLEAIPPGRGAEVASELIRVEEAVRQAGATKNPSMIEELRSSESQWPFVNQARHVLIEFAESRLSA